MSHGKFTKGYLPAVGDVTVTGPFDPDDGEVNFARIIFLVVQGRPRDQGTVRDTVVVRGTGVWNRNQGAEWRGTVQRRGVLALGPSARALQVIRRLTRDRTRSHSARHVLQGGRPRGEELNRAAIAFDSLSTRPQLAPTSR
jgi:hypothetical protein